MIKLVLSVLGLLTIWFAVVFIKDFMKNKNNLEKHNTWGKVTAIGFITNFFDTLGIGSFAPTTALLRAFKQTKDRVIPGTLNVSCTIPVVLEAFIFMTVIQVDPVSLIAMLAAATIGAWVGAGIVSKLPERKVQIAMGVALFITAFLMLAGEMKWMPGGGETLSQAFDGVKNNLIYKTMEVKQTVDGKEVTKMLGVPIGVNGLKLIVAVIANFILGALMTAGIGLYAPCMALVYFLGMSPRVAFPIMMGSCAFLMPVASVKFVKEGAYDRRASMGITIGGVIGVIIAAYLVRSLPLKILKWLVIVVIFYTSTTMLRVASKNKEMPSKPADE
ncbi:sulfite exporter TauE/SafE family protein [Tepidibacter thalassicus]|uniref:Probable membrane transporter protein n=1 Tax=Tepidibacter thalassicus DSM 15285 TaxID=1123350 RepID=A0A1M5PIX2_9FIRM|nr:sulfite exporter TauE/SafE family protein [Tepidibacter thalassicus]SHH01708.1 Sulfite exporter TauE/SafE [Tepidibacter thalassicus DSM 15285]